MNEIKSTTAGVGDVNVNEVICPKCGAKLVREEKDNSSVLVKCSNYKSKDRKLTCDYATVKVTVKDK